MRRYRRSSTEPALSAKPASRYRDTLLAGRDGVQPREPVFSVSPEMAFRVRFGRMTARAGLSDLTFHDLRHEATSRLALRYPNPMDLRRVTGHADLKSLDRYYQPDLSELARRGMDEAA